MNKITWIKIALSAGLLALLMSGCQGEEKETTNSMSDYLLKRTLSDASPTGNVDYFMLPESNDLNAIPEDPNNPLTADKVALGKLLFHETGLAGGMGLGFAGEGRVPDPLSAEEDIDVQQIRTPSALNSAYQVNMLWNGQFGATGLNVGTESQWTAGTPKETNNLGYEGIETQAIAGLGVHRMDITEDLVTDLGLKSKFDDAFANRPEAERYNKETAGLAIAAYERTLLANRSPFQMWLRGQRQAMSEEEKIGAIAFFGEAQCSNCHTGPALNEMEFHGYGFKDLCDNDLNIVMRDLSAIENLGRGGFTGNAADNYKFKTPQLYNLLNSPHYGHGGTFHTVRDVVEYKNDGVKENPNVLDGQLAADFHPLGLDNEQVDAITAFISNGLYDAELMRYEPEELPSGNCFPNADEQSRADLGCD
jgi:cytochrome c peroxidase